MTKIKQIKIGFVESDKKTWIYACSSVTLIQDNKTNILVDTGGKGFAKEIISNLKKEKLTPQEINYVINTHNHLDHIWNNAYFENAKFISSAGILDKKFTWGHLPIKIGENIEIIPTPGHSKDSCSVIVKTEKGVYAIVGDLVHGDIKHIPSFEKDKDTIIKNKAKILAIADYIVPGHDKMIEVKRI